MLNLELQVIILVSNWSKYARNNEKPRNKKERMQFKTSFTNVATAILNQTEPSNFQLIAEAFLDGKIAHVEVHPRALILVCLTRTIYFC